MKRFNLEVTYGVASGFAMCVWVLIEFFLGFHTTSFEIGIYTGYFSIIIPLIFIFTALRERQSQTNGFLITKDGINIGFRMAMISGVIFTLFLCFYNNSINPDWVERMVEWQRKKLILSGASDDEIGRFTIQNRYRNGPVAQTIMNLVNVTGIGVVITLIEIPIIKTLFSSEKSESN